MSKITQSQKRGIKDYEKALEPLVRQHKAKERHQKNIIVNALTENFKIPKTYADLPKKNLKIKSYKLKELNIIVASIFMYILYKIYKLFYETNKISINVVTIKKVITIVKYEILFNYIEYILLKTKKKIIKNIDYLRYIFEKIDYLNNKDIEEIKLDFTKFKLDKYNFDIFNVINKKTTQKNKHANDNYNNINENEIFNEINENLIEETFKIYNNIFFKQNMNEIKSENNTQNENEYIVINSQNGNNHNENINQGGNNVNMTSIGTGMKNTRTKKINPNNISNSNQIQNQNTNKSAESLKPKFDQHRVMTQPVNFGFRF